MGFYLNKYFLFNAQALFSPNLYRYKMLGLAFYDLCSFLCLATQQRHTMFSGAKTKLKSLGKKKPEKNNEETTLQENATEAPPEGENYEAESVVATAGDGKENESPAQLLPGAGTSSEKAEKKSISSTVSESAEGRQSPAMRFFRKFSKQKKTPIPDVPANEVAEEEDESSEVEEKPAKPPKHKAESAAEQAAASGEEDDGSEAADGDEKSKVKKKKK